VLMEFAFDAKTGQRRAAARATNTDHWPTSMNRLQQRIGAAAVQDRGEDPA
jgi:hypothetical protein